MNHDQVNRWQRRAWVVALLGLVLLLGAPATRVSRAQAVGRSGDETRPAAGTTSGTGGDMAVRSATDGYLTALDQPLRDLARAGGGAQLEVRLVTNAREVDWRGLVQAVPRAQPEIGTDLTVWYGKVKARDLAKMASLPFLVQASYVQRQGEVPRYRDPDWAPPVITSALRERLADLRDHPPAGPVAPTLVNGWWDVGPGHSSKLAWDKGYTGLGVRVADIDSGVDFCHPDLYGTWATFDASQSRNIDYPVFTQANPTTPVLVGHYYDYFDGWPETLSPISNDAMIFDLFFNGQLTDFNTFVEGFTNFADTSATGTGAKILFQGTTFTTTGTATAANPVYHIGWHPDIGLDQIVWGEPVAVLVVDEDGDGVYESVYVDLNDDHDFRDDPRTDKANPAACWDANRDGYNDVSGGLLYFVSDGLHWPQMVDWWWNPTALGLAVPGAGDVVAFMYDDPITGGQAHGTLTAGNIAGQGRADGDPAVHGGEARPAWKPAGVGGMVQGAGRDVKLIAIGDIYLNFEASTEAALYFASMGVDGFGDTDDGAQITSNSYGESNVDNDEWDARSRLITGLNTAPTFQGAPNTYGQRVAHLNSTGNGGSGYGTVTSMAGSTAIEVGASTQFGSTTLFEPIAGPAQVTWGDVTAFSNRGPTAAGHLAPDVTGDGAFAAGDLTLNGWHGDGASAWETWGGTSRSTPVAAGNLALVYQAYRHRTGDWPTWEMARELLMSGANDQRYDVLTQGAGAVNADLATDLAGGRYGLQLSPHAWYPGDYRGAEHLAFAQIIAPGGSDSQVFTATNASPSLTITATLTATHLVRLGQQTFSLDAKLDDESPYVTGRPDYLFDVARYAPEGIPAGTDLMVAEIINPFEQFEPQADSNNANNSVWRVLWYRATDLNADGDVWDDTNGNGVVNTGEVDADELNRMNYGYSAHTYKQVSVHRPLERWGDGLYLGLQHRNRTAVVPVTNLTLRVTFYRRQPWDWITLGSGSVSAGPNSAGTFAATITVPPGQPYGVYQGEIEVDVPGSGSYSARTGLIPIVVNVAFSGDAPASQAITLGGTPRADTPYDNSAVTGPQDWSWRQESGDWRFYFLDQTAPPALGTRLVIRNEWQDAAPNTDIDSFLLGPALDLFSAVDPGTYGPYGLAPAAGSPPAYLGSGIWSFKTTTGGSAEYLVHELDEGLHEVMQHTTRFQGDRFEVPFTTTVSTLGFTSAQLGAFEALTYTRYFSDSIAVSSNLTHTGGITVAVYGLSRLDFNGLMIQQDPTNGNFCDVAAGGIYTYTETLPANVGDYRAHVNVGSNDLDLFVLYDANHDGTFACPLEVVGTSTASAGIDDEVTVSSPPAGDYRVLIQGWQVTGGAATFSWYRERGDPDSFLRYRNADLTVGPAKPATFELYNVSPGGCSDATATCSGGILYVGLPDVPRLVSIPIRVNYDGPDLAGSTKVVNTATANAGDVLTYTLTLTNSSALSATTAMLTDTLPAGLSFGGLASGSGAPAYDAGNNRVLWSPDLAAGGSAELVFTATVNSTVLTGTTIANTAQVNNGQGVVTTLGPAVTTIRSIDLSGSAKTVDAGQAVPGQTLTYSLVVRNQGPVPAASARLTDTLPAHTTYVAGSATGGAGYDNGSHAIVWSGAVGAGSAVTLTYQARIDAPLSGVAQITNTAAVDSGFGDVDAIGPVTTTLGYADLSQSTKSAAPGPLSLGAPVTFTIAVRNTGTAAANAVMTDTLPSGLSLTAAQLQSGPGSVITAGNTITWTGTLDSNYHNQATVQVFAASGVANACAQITNTANVFDDQGHRATPTGQAGELCRYYYPIVGR